MTGIVDRIENGIAVVETDEGMIDLPAIEGLQDGDVVEIEEGSIVSIDRAATEQRLARIQQRLDRMLKKN